MKPKPKYLQARAIVMDVRIEGLGSQTQKVKADK